MSYKNTPNRSVSVRGVTFVYRQLGPDDDVPLILLHHLSAVLDNRDPRVVDGLAAQRPVITFDNRGVGASGGSTPDTIEAMARDTVLLITHDGQTRYLDEAHGILLGTGVTRPRPDAVTVLSPQATLLLCTDGLVVSPHHSIDHGLDRLRRWCGRGGHRPQPHPGHSPVARAFDLHRHPAALGSTALRPPRVRQPLDELRPLVRTEAVGCAAITSDPMGSVPPRSPRNSRFVGRSPRPLSKIV
ncbi:alpha/beta fold hydrolase [Streptomyces sp. NPDC017890]|uniref:alpha/beta fold hydrolase n=1 Tax=Streptomyces sp. NPDC017890 TaxID=3365015 RepID=UPI00378D6B99